MINQSAGGPSLLRWLPHAIRHERAFLTGPREWAETYGDVVIMPGWPPRRVQINAPDDIRHVLVTNGRNYRKTGWLVRGRDFLGSGLLTSEEPIHAEHRSAMRPGFSHRAVADYAEQIVDGVDALTDTWGSGATINISHAMARLTLINIGHTLLRTDLSRDADQLIAAFVVCQQFMMRSTSFLPDAWPTPLGRRYAAAVRQIDTVIERVIAERRGSPGTDVVTMLCDHRDQDGQPLSDRAIRDELVTLLWAGHETSYNALEWAWYLLDEHVNARASLEQEVDAVLATRRPTASDVAQLEFTGHVWSEVLRLYPPAWVLSRWALGDDQLPSGHVVVKNSQVIIVPYVVHRDRRFFSNPDAFWPERFGPDQASARPPFTYFPFGGGSRVCIGEHYARLQGVLVLARITQRWRLTLTPGQQVRPRPLLTLRPARDIQVRASRRT